MKASYLGAAVAVLVSLHLLWAGAAQAGVIASEAFDYDTGALVGSDGGVGWGSVGQNSSSAWHINQNRADGQVVTGSLAYSDGVNALFTTGNSLTGSPTASDVVDIQRNLDQNFFLGAGESFWFSALMATDNAATRNRLILSEDQSVGDPGFVIGLDDKITVAPAGNSNGGSGTPLAAAAINTTYLVVGQYTAGSSNASLQVWVNPEIGGAAPTGALGSDSISITGEELTMNDDPLNNVRWRVEGNTAGTASLDEIRIGHTFASVTPIPEPASIGIVSLGALALIRRRR